MRPRNLALVCVGAAALAGLATSPKEVPPDRYRTRELKALLEPVRQHFPEHALVGVLPKLEGGHIDRELIRYQLMPRHVAYVTEAVHPEWAVGVRASRERAAELGYRTVDEWAGGVLLLHYEGR